MKQRHRRQGRIFSGLMALWLGVAMLAQGVPALGEGAAPGGQAAGKEYAFHGVTMRFSEVTGDLVGVTLPVAGGEAAELAFDGAYIDFCYDGGDGGWEAWGCYLRNTLFYENLDWLATYALPQDIRYNKQDEHARRYPKNPVFETLENGVQVTVTMEPWDEAELFFEITTRYSATPEGYVAMEATLKNLNEGPVVINGAAAVIAGANIGEAALVEFPGNLPYQVFSISGMQDEKTVQGEYTSPLIHAMTADADINFVFADPMEKWKPSVTKAATDKVDVINLACAMDLLQPGETLTLGTQYIQAAAPKAGYQAAQALYSSLGLEAPTDGVQGAPIYSGHPAGVSDNDFAGAAGTLDDYTAELAKIKALGFDAFWMLPVFEHPQGNGSIYLPYNMEYIDRRYSKRAAEGMSEAEARQAAEAEMADFGQAAQAEDLRLLIDYVPHGPYKYGPEQTKETIYDNPWLTRERAAWRAWDRWWEDPDPAYTHDREEWDCYAFDFANSAYIQYMRDLAKKQAEDFGLTGTRIDADMGSMPNWKPEGDHRISQTGLYGGAALTAAIRQGFLDAGKTPLILPENFHATPYYAPATDLFYDMPFLRVTLAARRAGANEKQFAAIVAHWLKAEHESSPKGMQYGRFLENHDTVAPWYADFYDGKRAVEVYGLGKARALWVLLSTIDGAPIIYQNDEIGNEEFFSELLAMRKAQFGAENGLEIEYLNNSASGIVVYRRFDEKTQKLVLVNLTDAGATRDFSGLDIGGVRLSTATQTIVYGAAEITGDVVKLAPYGSVVIDLAGGEAYDAPNTAKQYLTTNLKMEEIVARGNAANLAATYQSFPMDQPEVTPAAPAAEKIYDAVAQYSDATAAGDYWQYMYINPTQGKDLALLTTLNADAVGVWRVGDLNGSFRWAGCGVNSTITDHPYFELDSDLGANLYGVLVFVAPEAGKYNLPACTMVGVGEAESAILVVLKNGEQQFVSGMLDGNFSTVEVPAQAYDLEAGDTLMFYAVRMDGNYTYVELEGLRLEYAAE